jgi:tRNA modification GTPase
VSQGHYGLFFFNELTGKGTIVALSTPPGRSGIGVIRLSGPESLPLGRKLLNSPSFNPEPNRAILRTLRDPESGDALDQAIVTYFRSPHSFTGEDVLEFSCHGSPLLLMRVIDILLALGARPAEPGEFTLQSLANKRLNLTQAEAIRDLIEARTQAAVRQAARQLGGELSAQLRPYKSSLIDIIVLLESSLEFVDEDLPSDLIDSAGRKLSELAEKLEQLAATFQTGRLLKEGIRVTLAGRPNVGKSSLFNSLIGYGRAIVTDIPGTTRDTIGEVLEVGGVHVLLTDTAGIRASSDVIERMGIERTLRAVNEADLTILVVDGTAAISEDEISFIQNPTGGKLVVAVNKSDLPEYDSSPFESLINGGLVLRISALNGAGLENLRALISGLFLCESSNINDFVITNSRHYELLLRTAEAVRGSQLLLLQRSGEELVLVGLHAGLKYLGEITGETTSDEILGHIFSTFCIGK